MSGFPIPLGGGSFEQADRYDQLTAQADRLMGRGVFTDDPDSTVRRFTRILGNIIAGPSFVITRAIENIWPHTSHAEDMLSKHERWHRIEPPKGTPVLQRRQLLLDHTQERPDPRLWKIANALERLVGVGNVAPLVNYAAQLDLAGHPRQFMFIAAWAVPRAYVKTLEQIERLDSLIRRWKPITVIGHVTGPIAQGFLTDFDESLTDLDVLTD